MFRKILYPTDFSTYSNAVIDCLFDLKPAGVREVIVLHVVDKRIFVQFPELSKDVIQSMKKSATKNILSVEKKLKEAGMNVETRIEMGIPFHQIAGIAKAEAVSMIVMGSHGKSLVEEMLLGSTTENVLRHATVPLLIEKLETKRNDEDVVCSRRHENPFQKLLYPTDFSDCSLSVIPYLKQLKDAGTKEIIIVHVQDMTKLSPHLLDRLPEFEDIDMGRLENIKTELLNAGIPKVTTRLIEGVPFSQIETLAIEEDAGMIAIGSHGKSMVNEMLLGSVSGKIVRRSRRPVLVIRRK